MADHQNGSSDNDNKKETIISSISPENTSNIPPKPPMHSSSSPSPHPPTIIKPPMHSSGNSIIFPTDSTTNKKSNNTSTTSHNRNVTPHTESLMTLFAKPVQATPQTPTLDVINSFSGSLGDYDDDNEQPIRSNLPPALPDYFTRTKVQENEIETPIQNNNSIQNVRQIKMDDKDIPFIPQTTTEEQKFERFHSECTQVTHNQVSPNLRRKNRPYEEGSSLYSNERTSLIDRRDDKRNNKFQRLLQSAQCDTEQIKPTFIGAFLFSLYQLVFCFALASAITRPSHSSSEYSSELLAPMVLMACLGSLISGPLLITVLGGDYPSLYPCLDMFLAPFYAQMAVDIDSVLAEINGDDDISVFLATFVSLNAFGMLLSGLLCILAGKVKLANLAGYLPYPVLCGFFSSVGISIWMSAFKVDTGVTIQKAIMARNGIETFARHVPSILGGTALWLLGPRGAHYLVGIIASTVCLTYLMMLVTGTSLDMAQDMSYFWKREEVIMSKDDLEYNYGPPSPFGLMNRSVFELICWPAFKNGIPGVIAMSVIYLLRCSIHAGALTKCSNKLKTNNLADTHPLSSLNRDKTRQNGDMEHGNASKKQTKPKDLLLWYANGLFAIAFSGGFAVLPAIALGGIFAKMSAQSRSPQYGAMFILLVCYLSDFTIASYVPKCTFSSLLVFAALDLLNTWFIKSYQKSATEWLAVPFIVVISLTFGMLQSVALGLVCSTLIFVGSFQRAGVVKFIANGLTIRSTIERSYDDNDWLDQNADQIQVIVLQNYLFFGNANSCMRYIESMFDPCDGEVDLPPIPKYIILDLSIMTGIDTSAVDVLGDISALCKEHKCSLIFAGIIRSDIKRSLITGGVKPSRTNKHLNFSSDLDSALGKAEDELLKYVGHNEEKVSIHSAFSVLLFHHLAL